jgi:hypothetical protein
MYHYAPYFGKAIDKSVCGLVCDGETDTYEYQPGEYRVINCPKCLESDQYLNDVYLYHIIFEGNEDDFWETVIRARETHAWEGDGEDPYRLQARDR